MESLERPAPDSRGAKNWKFALNLRIWSEDGPKGWAARSVLSVLLWHSDERGKCWLGVKAISKKAGIGSDSTTRNALDELARTGWISSASQSWFSLSTEQKASGHRPPRRDDAGQAPNLYTIHYEKTPESTRPDVNRANETNALPTPPALAQAKADNDNTPRQFSKGPPEQICTRGALAKLPVDPDQIRSISKEVSAERETRPKQPTHHFLENQIQKNVWGDAWNVLVEEHAEKSKIAYGVRPLPPDVKADSCAAVAECLDGVATDLMAILRSRDITCDFSDIRRKLAKGVMKLYFKRDNEHLRRVKHALRDLPREFHARIIEAKQMILLENQDAQPIRTSRIVSQASPAMPVAEILARAQRARNGLEMPAKSHA